MKRLCFLLLLLPALAACQWMTEDYDEDDFPDADAARYINITVSVSAGSNPVTRAPLGGEYGDGVEKGLERENAVKDITLIFYELAAGATLDNPGTATVSFVKKYDVHPADNHNHTAPHTDAPEGYNNEEVVYTTGDRRLDETSLELGKTYHMLVVANADPMVVSGEPISEVRDKVSLLAYTGSGIGPDASDFVMTSSADATVKLDNPEVSVTENKYTYKFECIHIERLAARIDFWTKNGTFDSEHGGYKYTVGTNGEFVVVTKVTPFNLYNEQEYLFKRVQDSWTATPPVVSYLGDETMTNYVVDPNTPNKDASHTSYNYLSQISTTLDATYTVNMNASMDADQKFKVGGSDNIIIGYPKENTLLPTSLLRQYATGLVFETKYYASAEATSPVTLQYYYFLRHQGEKTEGVYEAKDINDFASDPSTGEAKPMNFGIVRNNIYRVSVESFSPVEGNLKIRIEEKHWRHVDNPAIYL